MDYLDPKKQLRHRIILFMGYACIALAIAIGTLVLVYQAYGFGVARNGTVIQSGLTFFSSQPNPATITLNGVVNKAKTNARIVLPENIYHVVLSRDGYRSWQRTVQVDGGSVHHFDYPLLFPKTLTSKKIATYTGTPGVVTQSPDRRWLMVQQMDQPTSFDFYDLKNPTKPAVPSSLPASLITKATSSESWLADEWADDNDHVLLEHKYDDKTEYILLDRTNPDQSLNLSKTITGDFSELTFNNKKYDLYYLRSSTGDLQTASLGSPAAVPLLQHVLSYKTYSDDTILYATDSGAPAGKVVIKLQIGKDAYLLRTVPAGTTYPLNLTKYSGDLYVILGASSENKLYIYKDPVKQLVSESRHSLVPAQVLHVNIPNYVSFSTNAQFIMAENGSQFGVYDIENDKGYNYTAKQPVDAPAVHAAWMDGDRLTYVSAGKMIVFDYDYTNQQTVISASSNYVPAFAPNYRFIYTMSPAAQNNGQTVLTQTSLLIPADQ